MRSITFISLIAVASMATADVVSESCYERTYTDQELAQSPSQIVEWMHLETGEVSVNDNIPAVLTVRFADQGRVKGSDAAGETGVQYLLCRERTNGQLGCSGECDSGYLTIMGSRGEEDMVLLTQGLTVGDPDEEGCSELENIVPILKEPVAYRLYRKAASLCEGF